MKGNKITQLLETAMETKSVIVSNNLNIRMRYVEKLGRFVYCDCYGGLIDGKREKSVLISKKLLEDDSWYLDIIKDAVNKSHKPNKLYQLFEYYSHEDNQNDIFEDNHERVYYYCKDTKRLATNGGNDICDMLDSDDIFSRDIKELIRL